MFCWSNHSTYDQIIGVSAAQGTEGGIVRASDWHLVTLPVLAGAQFLVAERGILLRHSQFR